VELQIGGLTNSIMNMGQQELRVWRTTRRAILDNYEFLWGEMRSFGIRRMLFLVWIVRLLDSFRDSPHDQCQIIGLLRQHFHRSQRMLIISITPSIYPVRAVRRGGSKSIIKGFSTEMDRGQSRDPRTRLPEEKWAVITTRTKRLS